ncbi:MAG: resolvase [Lachnospiraceae bacterium]|nr:resolvase [Lachnospiraceae bacterium]
MNENSREFFEKMQEFLPTAKKECCESVREYGEVLETVVIEDIFMPRILDLLAKNENSELLKNMFNYFEEIIDKQDPHLVNIFSTTVLEILGNDKVILDIAKQYMGPKTVSLQIRADRELGRYE